MTAALAPLPFLGIWKLTECESSRPEILHPTSGTVEFVQEDDGIHYINRSGWSNGMTTTSSVVFQLDGSWCPVTGAMMHDSMSLQQLEDGSFEMKMRKGGTYVGVCRATISSEAGILSGHWEIASPNGSSIIWETKSERQ